jgi:hypothetical protein
MYFMLHRWSAVQQGGRRMLCHCSHAALRYAERTTLLLLRVIGVGLLPIISTHAYRHGADRQCVTPVSLGALELSMHDGCASIFQILGLCVCVCVCQLYTCVVHMCTLVIIQCKQLVGCLMLWLWVKVTCCPAYVGVQLVHFWS